MILHHVLEFGLQILDFGVFIHERRSGNEWRLISRSRRMPLFPQSFNFRIQHRKSVVLPWCVKMISINAFTIGKRDLTGTGLRAGVVVFFLYIECPVGFGAFPIIILKSFVGEWTSYNWGEILNFREIFKCALVPLTRHWGLSYPKKNGSCEVIQIKKSMLLFSKRQDIKYHSHRE